MYCNPCYAKVLPKFSGNRVYFFTKNGRYFCFSENSFQIFCIDSFMHPFYIYSISFDNFDDCFCFSISIDEYNKILELYMNNIHNRFCLGVCCSKNIININVGIRAGIYFEVDYLSFETKNDKDFILDFVSKNNIFVFNLFRIFPY